MALSGPEKRAKSARRLLWAVDSIVNYAVLTVLLAMLAFGIYSLWDTEQVYVSAESAQYEVYKPAEDSASFEELRAINPDVFGWLTIYGTGVDYPLLQGEDNIVYLSTDATGQYSTAGSIYLDSHNAKDFSDYNSIIHGHHMESSAMFGDLSKFSDKSFFDTHQYGNLYVDGRDYGIVFFEYALVDAYDDWVYKRPITDKAAQEEFLEQIMSKADFLRQADQRSAEHILILNTCNASITNGRSVLIGYLTDQVYENPFYVEPQPKPVHQGLERITNWRESTQLPLWLIMIILLLLLIMVLIVFDTVSKQIRRKKALRERSCKKEG